MPKKKMSSPKSRARKPAKKKKTVKTKRPAKSKKKAAKKTAQLPPELPWREPLKGEKFLGVVEDFFGHIGVVAFTLKAPLNVGDAIHVRGHTSDFTHTVTSMQINHAPVSSAQVGGSVGIKVDQKARKGDYIYKVSSS